MSTLDTISDACDDTLRLAELLAPALEQLPLAGHAWHAFSLYVKRGEDGKILVTAMRLREVLSRKNGS